MSFNTIPKFISPQQSPKQQPSSTSNPKSPIYPSHRTTHHRRSSIASAIHGARRGASVRLRKALTIPKKWHANRSPPASHRELWESEEDHHHPLDMSFSESPGSSMTSSRTSRKASATEHMLWLSPPKTSSSSLHPMTCSSPIIQDHEHLNPTSNFLERQKTDEIPTFPVIDSIDPSLQIPHDPNTHPSIPETRKVDLPRLRAENPIDLVISPNLTTTSNIPTPDIIVRRWLLGSITNHSCDCTCWIVLDVSVYGFEVANVPTHMAAEYIFQENVLEHGLVDSLRFNLIGTLDTISMIAIDLKYQTSWNNGILIITDTGPMVVTAPSSRVKKLLINQVLFMKLSPSFLCLSTPLVHDVGMDGTARDYCALFINLHKELNGLHTVESSLTQRYQDLKAVVHQGQSDLQLLKQGLADLHIGSQGIMTDAFGEMDHQVPSVHSLSQLAKTVSQSQVHANTRIQARADILASTHLSVLGALDNVQKRKQEIGGSMADRSKTQVGVRIVLGMVVVLVIVKLVNPYGVF